MSSDKESLVINIFKPNIEGISSWINRNELNDTKLKLTSNGNFRNNVCFNVPKFIWEIERSHYPNGKVVRIRTNGFSNCDSQIKRPISNIIRQQLLSEYKNCVHCGNNTNLCIDHKNDMYNNPSVLNIMTQTKNDFQVLCNKCNKDLKHHIAHKYEENHGKLFSVKKLGIFPLDNFDYPWEKGLTTYDNSDTNCKNYTYWYDIVEFKRKREIFISVRNINKSIINKIKLIE